MILDYFKLASKNLRSRKLRSWLTMLGIFIGIAAVVSLISLGQGLQNAITEQFQKIGSDKIILESKGVIGPPGSGTASNKLTEKDIEVVKNVKGVDSVASMIFKTAKIEFKDEIKFNFIIGMPSHDSEQVRLLEENQNIEIASGRDLKNSDKYKAIVGINYPLKKVFSKEVGLRDKIIIENQEFEVIGTLKRIGNPFDDLQQFLDFFSVLSFISLIILYFLPEQIFITWFKFARIYIPIALVLAVGGGATSNGSDLFNTDAEFFTTFFSVIFVVISIVLIIRAHRRLKRQAKTPPSIVGG